jgi:hypothetical protein
VRTVRFTKASESPLLVENRPRDDAGVVEVAADLVAQGLFEKGAGALGRREKARDVRLYQHAELVCPVELARLVRLDVDAYHVEPRAFRQLNIALEELVVGRGVKPIGVVGLIQHTAQVDGLAVQ